MGERDSAVEVLGVDSLLDAVDQAQDLVVVPSGSQGGASGQSSRKQTWISGVLIRRSSGVGGMMSRSMTYIW